MNDSKLPQVRPNNLPTSEPVGGVRSLRQSRLLLASGIVAVGGAVGFYFLTHYVFVSVVLAVAGIVLFGTRQLVRKSIALTATNSLSLPDSPSSRLEEIRKQVSKSKFLEKVEKEGTLAADQASQLVQQYKNLQTILDQKFEPSELTHSRYSDSILSSCLAIGENLLHVKSILENLNITNSSTDPQSLWRQQRDQASNILESNSAALNELATLYNSLNQIMTKEKYRDQLEQSMQQVRALAERAKQYSKS